MLQAAIFTRHVVAEQAELSCAGVDAWQKLQIMLDLFRNSLQTKSEICVQVSTQA